MDHTVEATAAFEDVVHDVGNAVGIGHVAGDDFDRRRECFEFHEAAQAARAGMAGGVGTEVSRARFV